KGCRQSPWKYGGPTTRPFPFTVGFIFSRWAFAGGIIPTAERTQSSWAWRWERRLPYQPYESLPQRSEGQNPTPPADWGRLLPIAPPVPGDRPPGPSGPVC